MTGCSGSLSSTTIEDAFKELQKQNEQITSQLQKQKGTFITQYRDLNSTLTRLERTQAQLEKDVQVLQARSALFHRLLTTKGLLQDKDQIEIHATDRYPFSDKEVKLPDARQLVRQGGQALAEKRYVDALFAFEEAMAVGVPMPLEEATLLAIGETYQGLKDYRSAIVTYDRCRDIGKNRENLAMSYREKARCLQALNRNEDARKVLRYFQENFSATNVAGEEATQKLQELLFPETSPLAGGSGEASGLEPAE